MKTKNRIWHILQMQVDQYQKATNEPLKKIQLLSI